MDSDDVMSLLSFDCIHLVLLHTDDIKWDPVLEGV
jgi:hypothetical protein